LITSKYFKYEKIKKKKKKKKEAASKPQKIHRSYFDPSMCEHKPTFKLCAFKHDWNKLVLNKQHI